MTILVLCDLSQRGVQSWRRGPRRKDSVLNISASTRNTARVLGRSFQCRAVETYLTWSRESTHPHDDTLRKGYQAIGSSIR